MGQLEDIKPFYSTNHYDYYRLSYETVVTVEDIMKYIEIFRLDIENYKNYSFYARVSDYFGEYAITAHEGDFVYISMGKQKVIDIILENNSLIKD